MQLNQFAILFGTAVILGLLGGAQSTPAPSTTPAPTTLASSTTTTISTTTPKPITVRPIRPPCRMPSVCSRRSPQVCGATRDGTCRRFRNVCELLAANRLPGGDIRIDAIWTHTNSKHCRRVRGLGMARCWQPCPARPTVCGRTDPKDHICVQTRDRRNCKVLANTCQLRNNNCHDRPRNNWRRTNRRRCGQMQLGDKMQRCHSLFEPSPAA